MIREVESHESRSNWKPMENIEVNNKHKNKDWKLRTILSILSFKWKTSQNGRLIKKNVGMQQWLVNYWEAYATVVSWMNVVSLLAMASINKFPSR